MHVLIVDDEPSIRETFQIFLKDEGYQVSTATDFFEAEPILRRSLFPRIEQMEEGPGQPVDIVVADIILPRVNGLALLERVREIDEDIPVVIITGEPDVKTAAEALRLGAYDYVTKPVTQQVLIQVVNRAADRRRLAMEKRRLEAENLAYQVHLEEMVAERTAELEQRNRELGTLVEIGQDISASLELNTVLERLTYRAAQVCGADQCSVFLIDQERGRIVPLMSQLRDVRKSESMWSLLKEPGYVVSIEDMPGAQRIIQERQPLYIPDVKTSSLPSYLVEPSGIKSLLIVPLISQDRVIGAMALGHTEPEHTFSPIQVNLAMAIATQAAIDIENARLFEQVHKQVAQLTVVSHVARQITSILDQDRLLPAITQAIQEGFDYYSVLLFLTDPAAGVLRLVGIAGGFKSLLPQGDTQSINVGLIGEAGKTGQSLLVNDVEQDPRYVPGVPGIPTRSELCVPLKLANRVIGVLDVQETQVDAFDETDVLALETLADQIAVAIENARLYENSLRHAEELALIHNVDVAITSILDLDEVLQIIYEQINAVMPLVSFYIGLYDEKRNILHVPITVENGQRMPPLEITLDESSGLSGWVIRTGQPLWVDDMEVEQDTLPVRSIDYGAPMRALMTLPLITKGRVIGVISAQSDRPHAFDEEHRQLFAGIATQVAIAVENARLYQDMAQRTRTLRLLADASAGMMGSLEPQEITDHLLTALSQRFVAANSISVFERGLSNNHANNYVNDYVIVSAEWSPGDQSVFLPVGTRVKLSRQPWMRQLFLTRQWVYVPDMEQSAWWNIATEDERQLVRERGITAVLSLPLISQEQVIGAVSIRLGTPLPEPIDELVDWAQTLVNQATSALVAARLYRQLETQKDTLAQAYRELQETNRLRTELVQNVGHELRTPLALIKGYAELVCHETLGPLNEAQRNAMEIVMARTATLEHLIYNLTMLQRVPREALAMEPIYLNEILQRVCNEFRLRADRNDLRFRMDLSDDMPFIKGDQQRLELVFSHLLDNAVKFSPNGGTITIRGWWDEDHVYVSIQDQGVGIPSEHLDRIFERFYQVDGSASRQFSGMGVGLALVWEIVEAHSGSVDVESHPGAGSTFTVTFPRPR